MIHRTFDEFEAFTDAVEDADLRVSLRQLERPQWSIRQLHLDPLHLQSGSEGGGNISEGVTRRDGWVLYFQTRGPWNFANGEQLQRDSVLVMGPGAEFCVASREAHDWMSVFIPATSLFPFPARQPVVSSSIGKVVYPGRLLVDRLRIAVRGFMAAAEIEPSVTTQPLCVASFSQEILCILRRIIDRAGAPTETDRLAVSRHQLLRHAAELIEECPETCSTVGQLARELAVSERTLRSAFAKYLGMSPYKYVATRRLNHARKLLVQSDPVEVTVGAAAAEVGFWDFGRFSEKYRRLFGELPSETLQRRRTSLNASASPVCEAALP